MTSRAVERVEETPAIGGRVLAIEPGSFPGRPSGRTGGIGAEKSRQRDRLPCIQVEVRVWDRVGTEPGPDVIRVSNDTGLEFRSDG